MTCPSCNRRFRSAAAYEQAQRYRAVHEELRAYVTAQHAAEKMGPKRTRKLAKSELYRMGEIE